MLGYVKKLETRFFLLLFLILLPVLAQGEIREIRTMQEIVPHIGKNTLLVFDIDNTLLEPKGNLGSDQWFYYLYKVFKLKGWDDQKTAEQAMTVWNQTQSMIEVVPVEASTPALIQAAQKKGAITLGLTARRLDVADITLKQLESIHIHLDTHPLYPGEVHLPASVLHSEDQVLFKKGVIFVGEGNNKGQVLAHFMQIFKLNPNQVLFVDDKVKHVKSVSQSLAKLKTRTIAFRYAATDPKVRAFNEFVDEIKNEKIAQLLLLGKNN